MDAAAPTQSPKRSSRPSGDSAENSRLFRRCLGQYGTGIAIITTEGRLAAITVDSSASVSLDPPLVLWSITQTSRSDLALPSPEVGRSHPERWFEQTIISQVSEAHHQISSTFKEHRRANRTKGR